MQVDALGVAAVAHVADHVTGLHLTLPAVGREVRPVVVVAVGGHQVEGSPPDAVPPVGDDSVHRRQERVVALADEVHALVAPPA